MQKNHYILLMSETTEWEDIAYRQAFDDELVGLERRRLNDPTCTLENIRGLLNALYVTEGNNWEGRGAVRDLTLSAEIAAYEHFITEWDKEPAR